MSQFFGDSIFWIEIDKIKPNPYQPRREFDEARLKDLAESIRMYGVLQPLVVTRREIQREDGGLITEYELISGERRLRASKLAGVREVPAIIRRDTDDARLKLELAIIENLQREDLNPVDRARAFKQLTDEFHFKHAQIAEKVGKSREYVSNTMRILELPEIIISAVVEGRISEGHTRPLLMLGGRPEEQLTVFREIMLKKLTVRDAERIARGIAIEKVRKKETLPDADTIEIAERLSEALGTRVEVERRDTGGRVHIDFFSDEDLAYILQLVKTSVPRSATAMMDAFLKDRADKETGKVSASPAAPVVPVRPVAASAPFVAPVVISTPEPSSAPAMPVTPSTFSVPEAAPENGFAEGETVSELRREQPFTHTAPVAPEIPVATGEIQPAPFLTENHAPASDVFAAPASVLPEPSAPSLEIVDDRSKQDRVEDEAELYSIKNFSL